MKARFGVLPLLVLSASFSGCLAPFQHDFTPPPNPGAPTAVFSVVQHDETTFRFDGSRSSGDIINYTWDMGDGTRYHKILVNHTYAYTNGVYKVTLQVKNPYGLLGSAVQLLQVGTGENQRPRAAFTASTWRAATDEIVVFDSSASHDPDGDPLTYIWDANYPISTDEYRAFRAERGGTMPLAHEHDDLIAEETEAHGHGDEDDDGHGDHDHDTGPSSAPGGPSLPATVPLPVRPNHGSDQGNTRDAFYEAVGETTEDHGLLAWPMEGLFYVRLVVRDIKGDTDVEIWPILIEAAPPPTYAAMNWTGNLTLGIPVQNESTPASALDAHDQNTTTVPLRYPAPTFIANVSYERHPDDVPYQARDRITQRVALELRTGSEVLRAEDDNDNGWIRMETGPLPEGSVDVRVLGLVGYDIDYFVQVEMTFDTNPFTPEGFLKENR